MMMKSWAVGRSRVMLRALRAAGRASRGGTVCASRGATTVAGFVNGVAAELIAESGDDAHGEGIFVAGGEAGEEGLGDDGRGDAAVDGLQHCPTALARVIDVTA